MKTGTDQIKQTELNSSDTKRYYESLLRLLDKIELDEMDRTLNDDLNNIYKLLSYLEPNRGIKIRMERREFKHY